MTDVRGYVAPGFEAVRDAFARNFEVHNDIGAGCCLYVDGEVVVDLTGGVSDPETGAPYAEDTLQLVFSTTKGATAMVAHLLAERDQLDLDAPVVEYWPEFGAEGKDNIPVSWLLCHKSGVLDIERRLTVEEALDWDLVVAELAASKPCWEPGTRHGYHAVTYGHLVGEVVRRVTGKSLGTVFKEEIAEPLGLEFWIGLPEELHPRVSPVIMPSIPPELLAMLRDAEDKTPSDPSGPVERGKSGRSFFDFLETMLGPDNLATKAVTAPGGFLGEDVLNAPELWSAEYPAANGIGTAAALARLYAASVSEVDGVRLLQPETVERAVERQTQGPDAVMIFEIPFGLGFMRHSTFSPLGSNDSFGHYGFGGSLGFADPARRIGFGYTMNQLQLGLAGDPRTDDLIKAVYSST